MNSSSVPSFDITEFQSPFFRNGESPPKKQDHSNTNDEANSKTSMPPVATFKAFTSMKNYAEENRKNAVEQHVVGSMQPTTEQTVNESLCDDNDSAIDILLQRDIGYLCLTFYTSVARKDHGAVAMVYESPIFLLLHALKIKHELKFENRKEDGVVLRCAFKKGESNFDFTVMDENFQTEYPVVRQLCKKLGFYGVTHQDQSDLWTDELLDLCGGWFVGMRRHHQLLLGLCDSSTVPEAELRSLFGYVERRRDHYTRLVELIASRATRSGGAHDDPWMMVAQHVVFLEGAMREICLEKLTDCYSNLYRQSRILKNEPALDATQSNQFDLIMCTIKHVRMLHNEWAVDHLSLNENDALYSLHRDILEHPFLGAWYLERESMLSDPCNPQAIIDVHVAVLNGTFKGQLLEDDVPINEDSSFEEPMPMPERSAVLSPRDSTRKQATEVEYRGPSDGMDRRVSDYGHPVQPDMHLPIHFQQQPIHAKYSPHGHPNLPMAPQSMPQINHPRYPQLNPSQDITETMSRGGKDFIELHPPTHFNRPRDMKEMYSAGLWQQQGYRGDQSDDYPDFFSSDGHYNMSPENHIAKKSPINQSVCGAKRPAEKKRFGFC